MRAMLHYAFLKNVREHTIWAFLLGPLVLLGAPLLGVAVEASLDGRRVYPLALPGSTVSDMERMFVLAAASVVVAAAGAAAFWCFRSDIANRSLSFMLLALPRPVIAAAAAVAFGWCAGLAALAMMLPMAGLVIGRISDAWLPGLAIVAVAGVVSAAAGTLFAAYAPAPGTLVMVSFTALLIAFGAEKGLEAAPLPATVAAMVVAAVLATFAGRVMEAKCAA